VKQKIDFLSEPYEFVIAEEVLDEIKNLTKKERGKEKRAAELSLQIIEKANLQKITLNTRYIDSGLARYAKENNMIIATLDRGVKKKTNGPVMLIKDKKEIKVV
jgi:rRNA-processing protein FCF1